MVGSEIYAEAKSWQTGIASILGFSGLIVGALWNFHLNRRRDGHLRADEVRSVAAALYGEVILLRSEVGRVANNVAYRYWNEKRMYQANPLIEDDFLKTNRLSKTIIFDALASKMGILPVEMTIGISQFYHNFRETEYYLPLLVRRLDDKVNYTSSYVLEPARDAVRDVEPTLDLIQKMLKINARYKKVLTPDVDDVIELERQFFEE